MKTWLKKWLTFTRKPVIPDVKLNCGSFNANTGETHRFYQTSDGKQISKSEGYVSIWNPPEYFAVVKVPVVTTHIFLWRHNESTRTIKRVLYKETNKYTGAARYFFEYDGERHYMNTDALEKHNQLVTE